MKLKKENIYIDLRGKSKEELIDIYNLLISLKQDMYSSLERDLINLRDWKYYEFYNGKWCLSNNDNKTEVTIEQLKEILQPMENKGEFEKLFNYAKSVDFKISDLAEYIDKEISFDYYNQLEGDEPDDKAHFFALKYKDIDLSLEQQLQKAEAEVKRLQSLIEEENKPKVGDWAILWEEGEETPVIGLITDVTDYFLTCNGSWESGRKITDQVLINKLNELIK